MNPKSKGDPKRPKKIQRDPRRSKEIQEDSKGPKETNDHKETKETQKDSWVRTLEVPRGPTETQRDPKRHMETRKDPNIFKDGHTHLFSTMYLFLMLLSFDAGFRILFTDKILKTSKASRDSSWVRFWIKKNPQKKLKVKYIFLCQTDF